MKISNIKLILKILNTSWWEQLKETDINVQIIKKCLDIYMRLPKILGKILLLAGGNISILLNRYFTFINNLYFSVFLIQGNERYSGKNLNVIFLDNNNTFSYLHDKLFYGEFKSKKIGKCFIWNVNKYLNNLSVNYDALFIKSDVFFSRFFEKKGFIVIPEFVSLTLNISKPIEKIVMSFKKSIKEDIRKIKKIGYTFEISTDPKKLKMFYYQMYLPYINKRYGKLSRLSHYEFFRYLLERNSKLILTKLNDEYLFGALFSIKKDKIITSFAGAMEGKAIYMKSGLGATPYYFLILWAKENGYSSIDFGKSNPFLDDGLLKYKTKWGASIKKTEITSPDIIALKENNSNQGIISFLKNNHLISIEKNKFKGIIFLENRQKIKSDEIQGFLKKYNISSLTELEFKSTQDFSTIFKISIK